MSAQVQTVSIPPAQQPPRYSFLAQPPPQKKRPSQPLPSLPVHPVNVPLPLSSPGAPSSPSRRRSSTFNAITTWALSVQPGSPSSPASFGRRGSAASITHHKRAGSTASFLHLLDTPSTASHRANTPSVKDFDLTNLGYNSVFLHLPYTPTTPSPYQPKTTEAVPPVPPIPATSAGKQSTLKRFRSLGMLKPLRQRAKSTAPPPSPRSKSSTTLPAPPASGTSTITAKKAKYGLDAPKPSSSASKHKRSKSHAAALPPTLQNELMLMQFIDGGSMEKNVKRAMATQAKQAAGSKAHKGEDGSIPRGDVFRDENGGIWRDQDEEWEYAHLLGGERKLGDESSSLASPVWVPFGNGNGNGNDEEMNPALALATLAGTTNGRRGSASSQGSTLSHLDAVTPNDDDNLAQFGEGLAPLVQLTPGSSVLAAPRVSPSWTPMADRKRGKARRRPAPLTLALADAPPPYAVVDARKEFLEDSFEPSVPLSAPAHSTSMKMRMGLDKGKKKFGLFKRN